MDVVARLGSFAAAAPEVGMSVPTLSREIARLEHRVGVRLFERHARGVVLTDAGKDYYARASAALKLLREASASLERPSRTFVRVTTIPAFATRWLVPRLGRFHNEHPDIEVDVRTSIAFDDLEAKNIDFAIRLAPLERNSPAPLCPIHVMPVWSERHLGLLADPTEVARHTLLSPDHRPEFWREWLAAYGIRRSSVTIREVDSLLLYELARRGLGVAIGIEPLVSEMIEQNLLSAMDKHRVRSKRGFFLIGHPRRPARAGQIFRKWLLREAGTRAGCKRSSDQR